MVCILYIVYIWLQTADCTTVRISGCLDQTGTTRYLKDTEYSSRQLQIFRSKVTYSDEIFEIVPSSV